MTSRFAEGASLSGAPFVLSESAGTAYASSFPWFEAPMNLAPSSMDIIS